MTAPERFAQPPDSPLAPRAPSIHGTFETSGDDERRSARGGKADIIGGSADDGCAFDDERARNVRRIEQPSDLHRRPAAAPRPWQCSCSSTAAAPKIMRTPIGGNGVLRLDSRVSGGPGGRLAFT